jgi:nitroimidazol reductase NimA-like FMN-containing flavoprotein (pyridoxamine 5'-phosphate oxidase superfamily)
MHELTESEITHLLETQPVAHIGVISRGVPYVTPASFVYVDGSVWFRAAAGRRVSAMEETPTVCVEVTRYHQYTGMWESVVAWGEAVVRDDPRHQLRLADLLEDKYRDPLAALEGVEVARTPEEEIVAVEIPLRERSGRASLRPDGARSRPGRL